MMRNLVLPADAAANANEPAGLPPAVIPVVAPGRWNLEITPKEYDTQIATIRKVYTRDKWSGKHGEFEAWFASFRARLASYEELYKVWMGDTPVPTRHNRVDPRPEHGVGSVPEISNPNNVAGIDDANTEARSETEQFNLWRRMHMDGIGVLLLCIDTSTEQGRTAAEHVQTAYTEDVREYRE